MRPMKRWLKRHLVDLLLLVSGSVVMALFLIPHQVVPGGVGGLAMIANHFFKTPIGMTSILLNIPLFVIGVRVLGKSYGVKSLLGMLLSSALIDVFTYVVPTGPGTSEPILACIFGGLTLGAGLGLVFRGGGSTGGSDIVGMVLNRVSNLSVGSAILVVDFMVISAAGLAYGHLELALYGYLNLYLQSRAIDLVLEGMSYTRAVFVISEHSNAIGRRLMDRLRRGATLLHGTGAYTGQDKRVLFSVLSKKEVGQVREIVREVDPMAFMIVTDVYDVFGEGFRPRNGLPPKPSP